MISNKRGLHIMYLFFNWLQLSRRSMGVINTLQPLTFNILPQPLTPLMADWLCKGWKPCSWEWHESIFVCQIKAGCTAAELLIPTNTVSIWSHSNHKESDYISHTTTLKKNKSSRLLALLLDLPRCGFFAFHPNICHHSKSRSLPPLQFLII